MHEVNGPAFLMPIADAKVAPGPYGQTGHSTEADIPAQGRAIPREATAISEDYSEFLTSNNRQDPHPEDGNVEKAASANSLFVAQRRSVDEDGA